MDDRVVISMAAHGKVRAYAALTGRMVNEAQRLHQLYPIPTAALGRTLTAAAMMSLMLKGEDDTLTIQIRGSGPLGGIVVAADSEANVRGYVYNPYVDLPLRADGKLDVGAAVGKEGGYLNVIKDIGLKNPYIGYIPLVSGEIAEDITRYFLDSEQIPSSVGLGVLVDKDLSVSVAGGFIIQLMPDAGEEIVSAIEKSLSRFTSVTSFYQNGGTPESLLEFLLGDLGLEILETHPCQYACNCSRERFKRAVLSLGRKEISDIIEEQGYVEVQCHFCNKKYSFSGDELLKQQDQGLGEN